MLKDLYSHAAVTQLIDPAVVDADANSASIDLKSHQNAMILATIGEGGITFSGTNKVEFELEESTDDSTFTDVAAADMEGEVTGTNTGCFGVVDAATDDDAVYTCQYHGSARYVRAVLNFSGTHGTGTPIGVLGIAFGKKYV